MQSIVSWGGTGAYKRFGFRSALFALLVITVSLFPVARAIAEQEEISPSHAIAIAYDNSGSMYFLDENNAATDRWCYAKYSMEVLATMLGERDSLTIYVMDEDEPKVVIDGTQPMSERVNAIRTQGFGPHDEHGKYVNSMTYIDPVWSAIDNLKASDADSKTLLVMTDGVFNDARNHEVQDKEYKGQVEKWIDQASTSGITTFYLGISDSASLIDEKAEQDIYVRKTTAETILDTVTEIANSAFGRASLPNEYQYESSGAIEFDFDVPMSKIVVLAQGKLAKVGSLVGNGLQDEGTKSDVRWSVVGPGEEESAAEGKANQNLHGQVAVFDNDIPKGTYTLDVSGADAISVYYMPWVDIAVDLVASDGVATRLSPSTATKLFPGDFYARMSLLDPTTGERLDSKLLDGAEYSLEVLQGDSDITVSDGSDEIFPLEAGSVDVFATATVPGGVRVTQIYDDLQVEPSLTGLSIDASEVPSKVRYDRSGTDESNPSGRVVVSKDDGTPFTDEEWERAELSAFSPDDLAWDIEKSATEPGVFNLSLRDPGSEPNVFEKLAIHLYPHIIGGPARSTSFRVESRGEQFNLGGTKAVYTRVWGTFCWWVHVIVCLLLAYIVARIRRPNLPNLDPYISFTGVPRLRKEKVMSSLRIKTAPLSLAPERGSFVLALANWDEGFVQEQIGISSIGLVAVTKSKFKLDESTARQLAAIAHDKHSSVRGGIDEDGKPETMAVSDTIKIKRGTGKNQVSTTISFVE